MAEFEFDLKINARVTKEPAGWLEIKLPKFENRPRFTGGSGPSSSLTGGSESSDPTAVFFFLAPSKLFLQ